MQQILSAIQHEWRFSFRRFSNLALLVFISTRRSGMRSGANRKLTFTEHYPDRFQGTATIPFRITAKDGLFIDRR